VPETTRISRSGDSARNRRIASTPDSEPSDTSTSATSIGAERTAAAAALTLVALAAWALTSGVAGFDAYPRLRAPVRAREALLCGAIVAVALLPFADRRGIER
jgi:hypothetical protein